MPVLFYTVTGMILWIILWAIGAKPFDAFLLTLLLVLIGVVIHLLRPIIPGNRGQLTGQGSDRSVTWRQ